MGAALSRLRLALASLLDEIREYRKVQSRIESSPGLPVAQPTTPYWSIPVSSISQHGKDDKLPEDVDVVVIGSGITGAAVAHTLFSTGKLPKVVLLEARDACSGATARNGGHITPNLFHDYQDLKTAYGGDVAKQIIHFRLGHLQELLKVATAEDILVDSQCRKVETYDLFLDEDKYETAKVNLDAYLKDFPEQVSNWRIVKNIESLQVSPEVIVGAITTTAGAIHPYRFVTSLLSRLLSKFPQNFQLFTNTPCVSIASDSSRYIVVTPKGTIRTKHVVHATNGWASHLLPKLRGKIVPVRGHMSAHRPGTGLGSFPDTDSVQTLAEKKDSWLGTRSFVMSGANTYNYLTQQPPSSASTSGGAFPPSNGELMFGGGLALSLATILPELGVADDHKPIDLAVGAYLGGAVSMYFGNQWGSEGQAESKSEAEEINPGRVLKVWTGILGISADRQPWVGRLPTKITDRREPKAQSMSLAAPGEWIAAGYTGEGMVHAYLSGKAVANMILEQDSTFPEVFVVTERRWKKANIEDLAQ
ncbi:FAD-dependent protein [Mycena indigotica]|uniref:FAD-dependent protein n=1 Tax=Mycena indigotica TaxID=2126181 RepID=A0A8H6S7R4_9AGAR|nr:FAD-dependent protein [Mycena indigotica]KAF7292855.1 FAD-dependent protein [Mycena indigotica]